MQGPRFILTRGLHSWACTGVGASGQLGTGEYYDSRSPVAVKTSSVAAWRQVSAGASFTCGVASPSTEAWCFGARRGKELKRATRGVVAVTTRSFGPLS